MGDNRDTHRDDESTGKRVVAAAVTRLVIILPAKAWSAARLATTCWVSRDRDDSGIGLAVDQSEMPVPSATIAMAMSRSIS